MTSIGWLRGHCGQVGRAGLVGLTLLAWNGAGAAQEAHNSSAGRANVSVPAGSLEAGLLSLGRQANLRLLYPSELTRGKRTAGVGGLLKQSEAIARLLAGTGLQYTFTGANTVRIFDPSDAASALAQDGAIPLDPIDVQGGIKSADRPYETSGSVSHISGETIEHFRGTSPADVFRGVPGVMSGDARNGSGIDVNIRGLQGVGRVPVTIDGAMNATTAYQGYQGVANRTYVDIDLLSSIDIQRGPSNGPLGGIGGTVSMHTIGVDDIVKPGEKFGIKFKAGFNTNTSEVPKYGTMGGFGSRGNHSQPPAVPSSVGMDRPSLFEPTDGYGSIALGARTELVDITAAYARRKTGNYYAGTHGRAGASSGNVGPVQICQNYISTVFCTNYPNYYRNTGLTVYRHGEQVLNSSTDTTSGLVKAKVRLNEDNTVEFSYLGFRSEQGEVRSSEVGDNYTPAYQRWLSTVEVDTLTSRYRWNPADNDLIDFKWNTWGTALDSRVPTSASSSKLAQVGRPPSNVARTLVGADTRMWGSDLSNTARFATSLGDVTWEYGGSYLNESTAPTDLTVFLEEFKPRDGKREEAAFFTKADLKPFDWLKLTGGFRYQHFSTTDRAQPSVVIGNLPGQTRTRTGDGLSPNVGATITLSKGLEFYTLYSEGLRTPSLMESVGAYALYVDPNIKPERSKTWEYGLNFMKDGVLTPLDKARLKVSYFDSDIEDYISRVAMPYPSPVLYYLVAKNIYAAKFSGIEASGRYDINGLSIEFAGNYYTKSEFCLTASSCSNASLPADYAANHIPPKYMASLTVSQKFFDDLLMIGGRVSHVGPRAAEIGETVQGASTLVAPILWNPYTLLDAFMTYKLTDNISLEVTAENLTDIYYVNPLSNGFMPSPGRTIRMGMTGKF